MKQTIYETITSQIVTAIEEGAATYRMPWHRLSADITCPVNAASGRGYRGLNVITLWMIAQAKQFQSGTWATYQQWLEKGAQVRKGEKSANVFFWKNLSQESESGQEPTGEQDRAASSRAPITSSTLTKSTAMRLRRCPSCPSYSATRRRSGSSRQSRRP